MGIGAAFAAGLVKGFTQNIEREQTRRTAERDRLKEYESMALKAVLEGDATKSGFNAVQQMVQKGFENLDNQKPIDIFGTRGEDVVMDMTSMQGLLDSVGSNYLPGTGTYQIGMDDDLYERYTTDRGDMDKESNLWFQTLNDHRNKDKEAFDAHYKANPGDMDILKGEYKKRMLHRIQGLRASTQEGQKFVFSPQSFANYDEWVDLLGLNSTAERGIRFDALKEATADVFTSSFEGADADKGAFTIISSHLLTPTDETPYRKNIRALSGEDDFMAYSSGAFEMTGADMGVLTTVAESKGATLDEWMYSFSKNFNSVDKLSDALMHVTNIANQTTQGKKINFASTDTVLKIGEYLETEITNDADLQMTIVGGLMGDVLSVYERGLINEGLMTEDAYKIGTNREEGFKSVMGGVSYNEFKTRLSSATTARQQLELYKTIVNDISTVKGTLLDSAVAVAEGFVGDTGTIDQLMDMIGVSENDADYNSIKAMAIRTAKGGERAERDTLAFIIAANMARAEDSAGRLSDGDLQRNLQKLTGGYTTKRGEILSIEQVIGSLDSQIKNLDDINNAVLAYGSEGMTVELRTMLRNMEVRDNALKTWTRATYKPAIGRLGEQGPISAADLKGAKESEIFVVKDGKGTLMVLEGGQSGAIIGSGGTVIRTGTIKDLIDDGVITQKSAGGASDVEPETQPEGGPETSDEVFNNSEVDTKQEDLPPPTPAQEGQREVLGTTGRMGSGTERGLQGVMQTQEIRKTQQLAEATTEEGGQVYYDEKTGTYKTGELPDTKPEAGAATPPKPEAPQEQPIEPKPEGPITIDSLDARAKGMTQGADGYTHPDYPGKTFKKRIIQSGPNEGGDEFVEVTS